jgi:DNA modification methylase
MDSDNAMLHAALWYAETGYAVFPCAPGRKVPVTEHGLLEAMTDAEQIAKWWTRHPDANVAIRTDGLLVIDVDGADNPWLADDPGRLEELATKDRPLANDFVSDDEFDRLLHAWFGNIARVLVPGRGFYIWGGYANCGNYPPVLKACGLYFSQAIIWDKQHPVLTRKDYMGAHEWSFYGWKEGAAHVFLGPNNATDLWHVKKINPNAMIHLTEKPVELAVRAMQYSSRAGENVLDLFGGSGSTLIAAEQTGRRAFLMELDPLYCDVIVSRFEKFTGRKAERSSSAVLTQ